MRFNQKYFLLCENATLAKDGKISLINVFDDIYAPKYPATHPLAYFVSNIEISDVEKESDIEFSLQINHGSRKKLLPQELKIIKKVVKGNSTVGLIYSISNLFIPSNGIYSAEINAENKVICKLTFRADSTPPEHINN